MDGEESPPLSNNGCVIVLAVEKTRWRDLAIWTSMILSGFFQPSEVDIPTVQPGLFFFFCTQDINAIKQETQPKLDKATKKHCSLPQVNRSGFNHKRVPDLPKGGGKGGW